ncbi:MAG: AsmA family protein [Verrucomicrobiota bacterium]|nr:AsmA family protein [Verrucomicrobiota bacterium]
MSRAVRIPLILAGVLCGLAVAALLAVNLYVQSSHTQARIQDELSQRLGATLRIQRISVTPWWGLKLTGITMPQDAGGSMPGDFLHAQTFRLRVQLGSLFSQRLVINEVSLIKPTITWAQNADGKWRLPEPQLPPAVDERGRVAPDSAAAAPAAHSTAPAAAPSNRPVTEEEPGRFTPEIRRVRLIDGNFRFYDAQKKPVAFFEGVRFRSNLRNGTALEGDASIAKTSLRDRVFLEELKSPLHYGPDELTFGSITAALAGGVVSGSFGMRPAAEESPFDVRVQFRDIDADRLITEAHGPAGMLQGKIEGNLVANGETANPNALRGSGEIYLRHGEVRQYSLLVALGQLLQLEDLKQLHFDQAHVRYHIDPGVVTVDELLLSSANLRVSAAGTIGFDGRLHLQSQLAINEPVRRQLFRAIRDNFHPTDDAAFSALDFRISGTVERPKTDLMEKLVGPELKDLGNVITGFFGGSKAGREKRKRKTAGPPAETAPAADAAPNAAAPESTPAPTPTSSDPQPGDSP